jgi:peptidoglycan/LPS O-acetylase OafA/YrhL
MSKSTSFFLDLLRVAAAFVVFLNHCAFFWRPDFIPLTSKLAHGAVIVFFVLSGYVIANSTLSKASSPRSYATARLSRLYSVVIPALLLTLVLQIMGESFRMDLYAKLDQGADAVRYILALGFLQNAWHLSASPAFNRPLWSLSYEFWYYALFGVAVFTTSTVRKLILLVIIAIIVGPNILLLMPCWILGVLLFLIQEKLRIDRRVAYLGFFLSLSAFIYIVAFLKEIPQGLGHKPLLFSGAFISDWGAAIGIFMCIFFFDRAMGSQPAPSLFQPVVRFCSDHTFSLYLYHYPLIIFVTAANFVNDRSPLWVLLFYAVVILLLVLALSSFTEAKRGAWRQLFERLWDFCRRNQIGRAVPASQYKV